MELVEGYLEEVGQVEDCLGERQVVLQALQTYSEEQQVVQVELVGDYLEEVGQVEDCLGELELLVHLQRQRFGILMWVPRQHRAQVHYRHLR